MNKLIKELSFIALLFVVALASVGMCYAITKDSNTSYLAGLITCMSLRR
jgi:uncharacterized membrane protein